MPIETEEKQVTPKLVQGGFPFSDYIYKTCLTFSLFPIHFTNNRLSVFLISCSKLIEVNMSADLDMSVHCVLEEWHLCLGIGSFNCINN